MPAFDKPETMEINLQSLFGRIDINPLSARFRSVRGVTGAKLEKTSLSADVSQRAFAEFMSILPILNSKNKLKLVSVARKN